MAREITSSDAAVGAVGYFYKAYRVVPMSVHGRTVRVCCEDLPRDEIEKNRKELSEVIGYNVVVDKRRLTAEEAERYFSEEGSVNQEDIGMRNVISSESSVGSGT